MNTKVNSLKKILIDEGITQAQLSRESEVNSTTINKICSGKHKTPTPVTMSRICNALNDLIYDSKYSVEDIFS